MFVIGTSVFFISLFAPLAGYKEFATSQISVFDSFQIYLDSSMREMEVYNISI